MRSERWGSFLWLSFDLDYGALVVRVRYLMSRGQRDIGLRRTRAAARSDSALSPPA